MYVRACVIVLLAIAFVCVRTQDNSLWVEIGTEGPEETERRYTPELVEELESAKADALLLYTEFTARASQSLKQFVRNISRLEHEARTQLEPGLLETARKDWWGFKDEVDLGCECGYTPQTMAHLISCSACPNTCTQDLMRATNSAVSVASYWPAECRILFEKQLKKAHYDAHRAATFSGENHHKFFLGHMIVFRMHLNKSEEYVKKCDKVITLCGIKCETQPRIKRWRRLAAEELNRLRDDLQHSRHMYRDLLTHAQRRLNTLKRKAYFHAKEAADVLRVCVRGG